MSFVRTWTNQLARAAGASLIAPLVLLTTAAVVASAGSLSSFGSLREAATGPSLPEIGPTAAPRSSLVDAEIVGADLSSPTDASGVALPARGTLASAGPAEAQDGVGSAPLPAPPREPTANPFERREPPPRAGRPPSEPLGRPSPPGAPAMPAPMDDLLDGVRGLGDTLREPLQPITDTILELLGGPPPRG